MSPRYHMRLPVPTINSGYILGHQHKLRLSLSVSYLAAQKANSLVRNIDQNNQLSSGKGKGEN